MDEFYAAELARYNAQPGHGRRGGVREKRPAGLKAVEAVAEALQNMPAPCPNSVAMGLGPNLAREIAIHAIQAYEKHKASMTLTEAITVKTALSQCDHGDTILVTQNGTARIVKETGSKVGKHWASWQKPQLK